MLDFLEHSQVNEGQQNLPQNQGHWIQTEDTAS